MSNQNSLYFELQVYHGMIHFKQKTTKTPIAKYHLKIKIHLQIIIITVSTFLQHVYGRQVFQEFCCQQPRV